jgi:hypothetical protein
MVIAPLIRIHPGRISDHSRKNNSIRFFVHNQHHEGTIHIHQDRLFNWRSLSRSQFNLGYSGSTGSFFINPETGVLANAIDFQRLFGDSGEVCCIGERDVNSRGLQRLS